MADAWRDNERQKALAAAATETTCSSHSSPQRLELVFLQKPASPLEGNPSIPHD